MTQEMLDKINQANAFMHHNHIRVVRQEAGSGRCLIGIVS